MVRIIYANTCVFMKSHVYSTLAKELQTCRKATQLPRYNPVT